MSAHPRQTGIEASQGFLPIFLRATLTWHVCYSNLAISRVLNAIILGLFVNDWKHFDSEEIFRQASYIAFRVSISNGESFTMQTSERQRRVLRGDIEP
jgi:hypothetical protein